MSDLTQYIREGTLNPNWPAPADPDPYPDPSENPDYLFPNILEQPMARAVQHTPAPRRAGVTPPGRAPARRTASSPREIPEGGNELFPYPVGIVLHGTQGVGKTALCAHLPKPGFIVSSKDEGIKDLLATRQCPEPLFVELFDEGVDIAKNPPWDTLLSKIIDASSSDAENIIIDSATWVQNIGFRKDCNENYDGDFGKEGYFAWQTGPKSFATSMWQQFIEALSVLKMAGKNWWLIAHTTVKSHNIPGEPSYDRFIPYLDKEVWAQTFAACQLCLFFNFEAQIAPTDRDGKRGRVQKGSQLRMIYTERTEAWDAKNRWGMTPCFLAGSSGKEAYENFKSEVDKCFTP